MPLAIDIIDGHGHSNEICALPVTAKEDLGNAVLSVDTTAKGVLPTLHN